MTVMTLIIKLILILIIPITFAQASFSADNFYATKDWEVRGFVFNTALQFWAKTSCRLTLSVPGSVAYIPSDCDQNDRGPDEGDSLLYYHGEDYEEDNTDIDGGKISGVVRSKVFGDILFGDKIPDDKNCGLLDGNDRKTKIVKFQDGVVRVTGCAYVKKLDEYIYLSPFIPSSNSKKTLTGANSAWLGLTAEITTDLRLNENLRDDFDGTGGITGGNFLVILGCGWSPNFGYWNFGLKDLSGNNNNSGVTDCEFRPQHSLLANQRIFDTRVGFEEPIRTGLTVLTMTQDVVFELGKISGACATGFGSANIRIGEKRETYRPNDKKQILFSFILLFNMPITITLSCANDPERFFIFEDALSSDVEVEVISNELIVTPQAVRGFGKVEVVSQISNISNKTKIECSVNRVGVDNINTEIIKFEYCGLLTAKSKSQQLVLSDTTFVQECTKIKLDLGSFDEDCESIPDLDPDPGIGSGLTDVTSFTSQNGTLYALVGDNAIYRINTVDGTKSPFISIGGSRFVLLTSDDNNFYGIKKIIGREAYTLHQISEQGVVTNLSGLLTPSFMTGGSPIVGLALHKRTLYMVSEDGRFLKTTLPINPAVTSARIRFDIDDGETITGLVSHNEELYVVNEEGQIHQADTTNGNLTFFANIVTQNINYGSLVSHDGELYAKGETDNALYKVALQEITELPPKTITVKALPTIIADRNKKSFPRGATVASCKNGKIDRINIPAYTTTFLIHYIEGDSLETKSAPRDSSTSAPRPYFLPQPADFIAEISNSERAPFPVRTLLRDSDCET